MRAHLEVTERRIRRLYVRPRALFAEAIVAARVDGGVVEFPAAAWDIEMPLPGRPEPIRIQVKCSGERAPQSPDKSRPAYWGRLKAPKSARDPQFGVLAADYNCDVLCSLATRVGTSRGAGTSMYYRRGKSRKQRR
jgi:hypothetical protein